MIPLSPQHLLKKVKPRTTALEDAIDAGATARPLASSVVLCGRKGQAYLVYLEGMRPDCGVWLWPRRRLLFPLCQC